MKVFISWSGEPSRKVAVALRDWIPYLIQAAKPFVSSEDVGKGRRWPLGLAQALESSDVGIICLTRDNRAAEWLLFEAGAISKSVKDGHACTLLLGGLKPSDVTGPLSLFQHTVFEKVDFKKLMLAINEALGKEQIQETVLNTLFEKLWPDIEEKVQKALKDVPETGTAPVRTDREMIEETLELCRAIARRGAEPDAALSARAEEEKLRHILSMDIGELPFLPSFLKRCLYKLGIRTVGALATCTKRDFEQWGGITKEHVEIISHMLEELGLSLGMLFDKRLLRLEDQIHVLR